MEDSVPQLKNMEYLWGICAKNLKFSFFLFDILFFDAIITVTEI